MKIKKLFENRILAGLGVLFMFTLIISFVLAGDVVINAPAGEINATVINAPTGRTAVYVVCASNSKQKTHCDYLCDGTDDQVEIQAAIDALPSGGGRVILMDGTYYITQSINLDSRVSLSGQGSSTILKVPDNTNPSYLPIIKLDSVYYSSISDLFIDGNKDHQSSGREDGIYINWGSHHKIVNTFIYRIYGAEGNGIYVNGTPYDILIQGNTFNHIQDDGMDINGMIKSQIIGNNINDCGDNGIDTEGVEFTTFSGNVILSCGGNGLELEQEGTNPPLTRYCTVTGNVIDSSGNDGIHVRSGGYNTISGNVIRNSGRYGIYFTKAGGDNAEFNTVVGNLILNSSSEGIYEENGNADYNLFTGNYLKGDLSGSGDYYEEAINGLHSQSYNDFWAANYHYAKVERRIRMYKNYQSFNIPAHSIVIKEKSTSRAYAINTTTVKGDDLVLGVVIENISANTPGFVMLEGQTKLRVNGITDIHKGDFLGTYTEAGVACKAESGDMAIAIALADYTADDSNGLIDVLVCTPRKI